MHAPIEPYDDGWLDVGDGQRVWWETCGNPDGIPAVVLHGGPGSGCTPMHRRWFDPGAYRIVLLDQRQCGRSTPHASETATDLSVNTTQHLLSDIEQLREHLGIEQWLVWGNSWGSSLAVAYAQAHPQRVSAMVLVAVTNVRSDDVLWLYHGAGRWFPEEWARFRDGVPVGERDGDLVAAYHRLLQSSDPAVRAHAARDWCAWEDAVVRLAPDDPPNPRYDDARFRMAFARIVTHYFVNRCFLPDHLERMDRIADIPAVLIHGFLDIGGPVATAWELAQAWPSAELVICGRAGHFGPEMTAATLDATDRFARLLA